MYITNIWGIFFCVIFPFVMSIILVYIEGVEDGKRMKNNENIKELNKYGITLQDIMSELEEKTNE